MSIKNNLDIQNRHLSLNGEGSVKHGMVSHSYIPFLPAGALNMTPTTFNVLLHLIIHWWKPYDWPHPSQESIAVRMGVSSRTVQRSLQELENYGLLTKIRTSKDNPKYKGRNIYDMSLLVKSLNILTPDLNAKLNEK
ncbi:helix-turn-helix domain-containing protein [Klebsiella pneumoniae]|uniref:helix-turn-helix domain-containing protein n=1 Tax=Klebsiella pneumoniae TaxID=573 RepID=UPI001E42B1B4|nr:helix-turn-helix domain-containing protein [Klebsiella pneumoniae]